MDTALFERFAAAGGVVKVWWSGDGVRAEAGDQRRCWFTEGTIEGVTERVKEFLGPKYPAGLVEREDGSVYSRMTAVQREALIKAFDGVTAAEVDAWKLQACWGNGANLLVTSVVADFSQSTAKEVVVNAPLVQALAGFKALKDGSSLKYRIDGNGCWFGIEIRHGNAYVTIGGVPIWPATGDPETLIRRIKVLQEK